MPKNRILIGFPSAGRARNWTTSAAIAVATYAQIPLGLARGAFGDITTQQGTGTGAGGGKDSMVGTLKRSARWVKRYDATGKASWHESTDFQFGKAATVQGVWLGGQVKVKTHKPKEARGAAALYGSRESSFAVAISPDAPLFEDKRDFLLWATSADVCTGDLGQRLQQLGQRAARRAGRRLVELRGVQPSETSLQDAASDAVLSVLSHVRQLDKATAAQWESLRLRRVLAMYAGRGAFNSLASWASCGATGDTAGGGAVASSWSDFLTDTLRDLQAERPQADTDSSQAARARVGRWVYRVGFLSFVRQLGNGRGSAAARDAARRRCRVVWELLHGAALLDAVAFGGFASVKNFSESCNTSGFWEALKAARLDTSAEGRGGAYEVAKVGQRAAALEVNRLIRAHGSLRSLRYLSRLHVGGGSLGQRARATAAQRVKVRQLRRQLAAAIARARMFKDKAAQALRDNGAAFDNALHGVRSGKFGNLRVAFKLATVVSKGKQAGTVRNVGASKQDGATIRRAKGSVSSSPAKVATVAVKVGKRSLACGASSGVTFDSSVAFIAGRSVRLA